MAYRVIYNTAMPETKRVHRGRRIWLTVFFLFCFCWLVSFFWPEGKNLIKILLIPGNPDSTLEAAEVFAGELACGSPLYIAAKNFCQTVFSNGYTG